MLDLDRLKSDLLEGKDFLTDQHYLEDDLKIMYEFYLEDEAPPEKISEYLKSHSNYEFFEFLKPYFESELGFEINVEYTDKVCPDNGWLKIWKK